MGEGIRRTYFMRFLQTAQVRKKPVHYSPYKQRESEQQKHDEIILNERRKFIPYARNFYQQNFGYVRHVFLWDAQYERLCNFL